MTAQYTLRSSADDQFCLVNMEEDHPTALQKVLDSIQQTNDSIREAIEAGISIELIRTARVHNDQGNWGDQITPAIRQLH